MSASFRRTDPDAQEDQGHLRRHRLSQPGVSIGCDNFHGGQLAGAHRHFLGRRKIAFLGHASSH